VSQDWYPVKWRKDDILGSLNLVTPESILKALLIVKKGIIYDLSQVLDQNMPIPGFHGSFFANTQCTLAHVLHI